MSRILTTEQQKRFAECGVVFPIRVLSPGEAAQYRLSCDALELQLGGKPRTVDVRQMHLHWGWAYCLATHPRVLDAVEDLLGPDLVIWATELFAKHPRDSAVSIAWHRDGPYMGLEAERTVTAWIALTKSTRANGGMRVVREKNRQQSLHLDARAAGVSGRRVLAPSEEEIIDVELQPGEMSLHDVHVLHGSGANGSDHKRVGFAIRFTTPQTRSAIDRPPAILARGADRYGHFDLQDPPQGDNSPHALTKMRLSARRHLDATLQNLKHATR